MYAHATHAYYIHTHSRMYTCAHSNRKSQLTKFCYDKLHVFKKNIRVRKSTSPQGPKKVCVPIDTTDLFDVGVSSHKT